VTHPPKPPDLELDFEPDELNPLELPPMPPDFDDVERRVIVPEDDVEVLGRTLEFTTGLFWNVPLE
jgi:hypothetical protein